MIYFAIYVLIVFTTATTALFFDAKKEHDIDDAAFAFAIGVGWPILAAIGAPLLLARGLRFLRKRLERVSVT